ncbi:hypothetical protein D9613_012792 [Agrocybe pediades]|uniref:Uncharacterized protein n=1 Tax=Agrocybe pediades TaxID=84607 RepID=A0A8H4R1H7_9AGAR|nr:hypothetical protein D9613_012792 [Agrocybe pediades]
MLSAVATLMPNLSPLPMSPSSTRMGVGGDDSDGDMNVNGQDDREENRLASSGPVLSGRMPRRTSVASSVKTLKLIHHDTDVRDESGDESVYMRSSPESPVPVLRSQRCWVSVVALIYFDLLDLLSSGGGPVHSPAWSSAPITSEPVETRRKLGRRERGTRSWLGGRKTQRTSESTMLSIQRLLWYQTMKEDQGRLHEQVTFTVPQPPPAAPSNPAPVPTSSEFKLQLAEESQRHKHPNPHLHSPCSCTALAPAKVGLSLSQNVVSAEVEDEGGYSTACDGLS